MTEDQASDGINYIDDWEQLIRARLIDECSPESSRIVEIMRSREMPPPNSGVDPMTAADIDAVATAIDLDCSE